MSKPLNDHIKALESELIAHAEKFPLGDLHMMPPWQNDFERVRANIDRLKYARGLIVPTGGSFPLNV